MGEGTIFYTVAATFDMREYGDFVVKSFKKRDNAIKFALIQKERFLQEIYNRELDEQDTMDDFSDPEAVQVYYGACKEGVNFIAIQILPDSLTD